MADLRYYGCYARIHTASKDKGAMLQGADNIVGDTYTITFTVEDGSPQAHLINKFGADAAYFDAATSRQLSVLQARGWTLRASLALVAYTDIPDPGFYWGEAVIICNAPRYDEECNEFASFVFDELKEGNRPEVDLGTQAIDAMLSAHGSWKPSKSNKAPKASKGTVVLKSKMSPSERIVEQGRAKNPGCYIVSWVFIVLFAAGILYGSLKLFGVI